ncbi:hypothetical protein EPO15_18545 [bacterium]|nr:MAG: hypothetical protein EPO15_18545 [bacterium]
MWALHESYDPRDRVLILDLMAEPCAPRPAPSGLPPTMLGTFADLSDARRFAADYLKTVARGADRVVARIYCGAPRHAGCRGPGEPCALELDDTECPWREGA